MIFGEFILVVLKDKTFIEVNKISFANSEFHTNRYYLYKYKEVLIRTDSKEELFIRMNLIGMKGLFIQEKGASFDNCLRYGFIPYDQMNDSLRTKYSKIINSNNLDWNENVAV